MADTIINELLFIVIFILPGLFIKYLSTKFAPSEKKELDSYEKNLTYIAQSLLVLILNAIILDKLFKLEVYELTKLIAYFGSIVFIVKYLLLSLVNSIIITLFIWLFQNKFLIVVMNAWNIKMKKPKITSKTSMWEEMFEDLENITNRVIVIEKEGKVVTQGVVEKYTAPGSKKTQLLLVNTQIVEKYFNELKEDDILYDAAIERELYDFDLGVTIKFYHSDVIIKYINNFYRQN